MARRRRRCGRRMDLRMAGLNDSQARRSQRSLVIIRRRVDVAVSGSAEILHTDFPGAKEKDRSTEAGFGW